MKEVKQRAILYSTPMVLANLAGIKTQTRRKIEDCETLNREDSEFVGFTDRGKLAHFRKKGGLTFFAGYNPKYGVAGDILYGRERLYLDKDANEWRYYADKTSVQVDQAEIAQGVAWAHHKEHDHCTSIHMPKFAARIWQEIVSNRVERLHDISKADALAEGIDIFWKDGCYVLNIKKTAPVGRVRTQDPVAAYIMLYNMINGITMQDNPWNWVIEYKSIERSVSARAEVSYA